MNGESVVRAAARLSNRELLLHVTSLAASERESTVELVGHLAELDARKLYVSEGYGSLFAYCTGPLQLAEHAAYNRIEASRLSRRFPVVLDLLTDGSLNLSTPAAAGAAPAARQLRDARQPGTASEQARGRGPGR